MLARFPVFIPSHYAVLLFACLAAACGDPPTLLNSERIRQKFGTYGIEIIHADDVERTACLYSKSDSGNICRTVAVVKFSAPIDMAYSAEHAAILAGGSIGEVFREAGWTIAKRHLFTGELAVPRSGQDIFRIMHIAPLESLATHKYIFEIRRGEQKFDYARITEIHHPGYLTDDELGAIYGVLP